MAEILLSLPARPQRRGAFQDDDGKSCLAMAAMGQKETKVTVYAANGYYPANTLPARRARSDAARGCSYFILLRFILLYFGRTVLVLPSNELSVQHESAVRSSCSICDRV
jgi:hypothetical protein